MRALVLMVVLGCQPAGKSTAAATVRPSATESAVVAATASADPSPPLPGPATNIPAGAEGCGPLECLAFGDAAAAFAFVLDADKPRVLAIGEAHAQKGSEGVDSATKRFREALLPQLGKKASDIVVELMLPAKDCDDAKKKVVEKVEKPVTTGQRTSNKNEFVELADRAKELSIQPWALTPSCAELKEVAAAGEDGVVKMLVLIAKLTRERIETLLPKRQPESLVVAYGGAMHNDPHPSAARKDYSFGPQLLAATGGHYTALELFVPEYIKDNDTWRRLPWYAHYDRQKTGAKATLFRLGPGEYVLIFPVSAR